MSTTSDMTDIKDDVAKVAADMQALLDARLLGLSGLTVGVAHASNTSTTAVFTVTITDPNAV